MREREKRIALVSIAVSLTAIAATTYFNTHGWPDLDTFRHPGGSERFETITVMAIPTGFLVALMCWAFGRGD
jgi:hypothetical protein